MRSVAGLQRLLSAPHVRNRLPLLACRPAARKICAKALKTPFEEMSGGNSLILPPDGTPKLDTAQFACKITINALRVPKQRCNELMRRFKGYTLDRPKMRCIVQDGEQEGETRLLLLDEGVDPATGLTEELRRYVASEGFQAVPYDLALDYSHLNADQVLKKLLPAGVDAPSSFETVGHIIHLNLREEQLPFKYLIGQVLLDKNPHVRTVVNKVGAIENEFRVFSMELLAGEARTDTEVVQHGTRFRLDFAQVYWNSRLETEHKRLVGRYFEQGQVVADIMGGIGPFAIPAAQQGCTVYANDLNPRSAHYCALNARLNRVTGNVHVFNMDGRAFVRLLCATPGYEHEVPARAPGASGSDQPPQQAQPAAQGESSAAATGAAAGPGPGSQAAQGAAAAAGAGAGQGSKAGGSKGGKGGSNKLPPLPDVLPPVPDTFKPQPGGVIFQHAVMNLPASAVEFLDAFNGAFDPETWQGRLPLVHLYTFMKVPETEPDIIAKAERYLGGKLEGPPEIHVVRDVSPGKVMLCVTFRVPAAVAFNGRGAGTGGEDQAAKRQRVMATTADGTADGSAAAAPQS